MSWKPGLAMLAALLPTAIVYAAMIGLGVARHGEPGAVALAATTMVFAPALAAGALDPEQRTSRFAYVQLFWSIALFITLPVYFPGERRDAVASGLALLTMSDDWDGMARSVADRLPEEPALSVARVPEAQPVVPVATPPPSPLDPHEIALPYEGEGRRLSVPVVFEHEGRTVETFMMLDTGATYTTLPVQVLSELDALPTLAAPQLTLNTANGERTARVVLLDHVWLGDLAIGGVAVTTCEDCASEENAGLLGLNVAGGYNVTIDADRREVIFSARQNFNRRLDVRPFSDLEASFMRYPGGRVELSLDFENHTSRDILGASAKISCDESEWIVDIGEVEPMGLTEVARRLPRHERCESYQVSLDAAWW